MISIIGLGGAGNQVANVASEYGFLTGAINFSQSDLDSAENVNLKLKLVGSEGVGKQREEAIRLIDNNWESAVNFIKEHFSHPSTKVIAFVFSTGGGSGSGISPILLDILTNEMPDKTFIAMPIIPDKSEVLVNQMNCLSTFEQLSKLDIAVFPIDNEKIKTLHNINGKNLLYKVANESAIDILSKIVSYTEKSSKNGNIDEKDLLQIFKTKGIGLMSEVSISDSHEGEIVLNSTHIAKLVQQSWNKSIFSPIEYNQVVRAGIILDGNETLMAYLDYEEIFSKFRKGMPIDLFEGNYHEQKGNVLSILTGLAWCNSRLKEIEDIIEEKRSNAESALNETSNQDYKSSVSSLNTRIRPTTDTRKRSVSDILSKYKR